MNNMTRWILFLMVFPWIGQAGQPMLAWGARSALPVSRAFEDDGQTGTRCEDPPPDARADWAVWPISGTVAPDTVVAPYGARVLSDNYDFHAGMDIPPVIPGETVVHAALDGRVVRKYRADEQTPTCRFGNWIMLRHANDRNGVERYTTYLHLSEFRVNLGDIVRAGDALGVMGRTGCRVNTEHLHFEYYEDLQNCGVLIVRSRNPMGLPLPVRDQGRYNAVLGRDKDGGALMLRAEIPGNKLDIVEYRIVGEGQSFRVDLNEKVGIAPSPCTKCCDKALIPDDNVVQLLPQRFMGGELYVLCIRVDNADTNAVYTITLRDAQGREMEFGPFTPADPPADVSDCVPSLSHGCSDVRMSPCDGGCQKQE